MAAPAGGSLQTPATSRPQRRRVQKTSNRSTPRPGSCSPAGSLPASDRRLLGAFGAHLAAQLERQQLAASRREVVRLAESNTMRTSILRAVSHDLRTPLAGIKLAVGGLRQTDVHYTPEEQQDLLATIDECSDRLDALVGNLLDMSRITSDSVNPLSCDRCAGTR